MAKTANIFTTIRTEGALLPPDLLQRISEGENIEGLTPASYHRPGEKLNEAINRSWNALQGAWANFKSAQERLPADDLGTTITRERWLLPLFRELDYGRLQTATAVEIDGRSYPISHGWEYVPIHLVSYRVDLDTRTKGVAGASSASPHSLVQIFLNRSDDNLWGFVSNGYKLRVLRDNLTLTRQAYVEFDLEAMMDGEVYSDFVLLWLLCHQSRVEGEKPADCWLEKWMKVAEEQGTRALEQLRKGVEAAIEALGLGFIEHPANAALRDRLTDGDLSGQDTYRQLLRIVYRLLFLFVAEDRDLLLNPDADESTRERYNEYYSTGRLRRMAESFKGTRHPDLFEGLRLVMRLLSGEALTPGPSPSGRGEQVSTHRGEHLLGLVPLGSFLFSDEAVADVIDCQISNRHLLDAVRALSLVYDDAAKVYRSVDYKNLGPEELGSVYESLLELHPQINVPARRFALATAGGNERKTTGSYYTPTSLINALLDSALDPVLDEAVRPTKAPSIKTLTPNPSPSGRGEQDAVWRARASEAMGQIAKDLRQRQTSAEVIMWEALRDRRLDGLKFRRQHAIANTAYVADFLCYEARLVVEIDGEIHESQRDEDVIRQRNIEAEGYTVLRFTNNQVYSDLESVLTEILTTARGNSPLPEGEGPGVRVSTTAEQRILNLKICDPACGSGHFLIAAANRMAKRLAEVRTGEEEPTPLAIQEAKRDIIGHCIYGVDINPMAVELCKVNLWMEALEPGKPLSFLDHRILVGNSLLGTTPRLLTEGIPDDAFTPIEGDDRSVVSALKKQNRQERKDRETGQMNLFDLMDTTAADASALAKQVRALDALPDDTLDGIRARERRYADLLDSPERRRQKLLADAWCSAFVWVKRKPSSQTLLPQGEGLTSPPRHEGEGDLGGEGFVPPMTQRIYNLLEQDDPFNGREAIENEVARLAERYQFFHWYLAFPDVFNIAPRTLTLNPSPSGRGTSKRGELPLRPEGEGGRWDEGRGGFNEQTGWNGGFDCVLGNPPWEHTEIKEKEWFAERAPEIANAAGSKRKQLIDNLAKTDPDLYQAFVTDKRAADGFSHFVRTSQNYPLTGRGRINTYPLFSEKSRHIINGTGRVGMIVPSGIATDDTTKFFFQDLMQTRSLASLYDFENRDAIFPGVHRSYKFSLVTMRGNQTLTLNPSPSGRGTSTRAGLPPRPEGEGGRGDEGQGAEFVFFAHSVADLQDDWRRFKLSAEDIATLNPNTGTMATFRSQRDAEITKAIYQRVPVLIQEDPLQNPWGITFKQGLFNMTSDSDKFRTREELEAAGFALVGNHFVDPHSPGPSLPQGERGANRAASPLSMRERGFRGEGPTRYLPLYEAKMMHQFTHRWATYASPSPHLRGGDTAGGLSTRDMTPDELRDPSALVMPRYWVDEREVEERIGSSPYLVAFRDIARTTDARTAIMSVIPRLGVGHTAPVMMLNRRVGQYFPFVLSDAETKLKFDTGLIASFCSLVFDYVVRQKLGGTHLTYMYLKQLPVFPPKVFINTPALLDFIVPRVLELTYTAWDLQPFAQDVGYDGPPFIWDEERRFLMRCELDALYFHLYGISRDDVDYIMETFPIVKRKDIARTRPSSQTLLPQGDGLTSPPRPEGEGDLGGEGHGGEYITKRVIMEMYDQMSALPTMAVPAPKQPSPQTPLPQGEGLTTYDVPDVSRWQTWLNPPPADPSVAHEDTRG